MKRLRLWSPLKSLGDRKELRRQNLRRSLDGVLYGGEQRARVERFFLSVSELFV